MAITPNLVVLTRLGAAPDRLPLVLPRCAPATANVRPHIAGLILNRRKKCLFVSSTCFVDIVRILWILCVLIFDEVRLSKVLQPWPAKILPQTQHGNVLRWTPNAKEFAWHFRIPTAILMNINLITVNF